MGDPTPQRGGWWAAPAGLGLVVSLWAVFFYAPTELTMGDLQRLFYFHISSWWLAFAAFLMVAGASVQWLRTRNPRYDMAALAAAEIGTLFATTGLAMGIIWAKPAWGIWWTWDARLTTAFVLWLIYVGYLMLRGYVDDPTRRANLAAVLGILGGADVPIVYFSIRWWRTQHPAPVIMGRAGLRAASRHVDRAAHLPRRLHLPLHLALPLADGARAGSACARSAPPAAARGGSMNDWLSAGYTAFFVLLGAYIVRLGLLEGRLRRERARLLAGDNRTEDP